MMTKTKSSSHSHANSSSSNTLQTAALISSKTPWGTTVSVRKNVATDVKQFKEITEYFPKNAVSQTLLRNEKQKKTLYDIGLNIGMGTNFFLSKCANMKCIGVEPYLPNEKVAKLNIPHRSPIVNAAFVSNQKHSTNKQMTFCINDNEQNQYRHCLSDFNVLKKRYTTMKVDTVGPKGILDKRTPSELVLVKIDCEGGEIYLKDLLLEIMAHSVVKTIIVVGECSFDNVKFSKREFENWFNDIKGLQNKKFSADNGPGSSSSKYYFGCYEARHNRLPLGTHETKPFQRLCASAALTFEFGFLRNTATES